MDKGGCCPNGVGVSVEYITDDVDDEADGAGGGGGGVNVQSSISAVLSLIHETNVGGLWLSAVHE